MSATTPPRWIWSGGRPPNKNPGYAVVPGGTAKEEDWAEAQATALTHPLRLVFVETFLNPLNGITEKCRKNGNRTRLCSKDGDLNIRGRRFWRDEKDGDSVQKPESWRVWVAFIYSLNQPPKILTSNSSDAPSPTTTLAVNCLLEHALNHLHSRLWYSHPP